MRVQDRGEDPRKSIKEKLEEMFAVNMEYRTEGNCEEEFFFRANTALNAQLFNEYFNQICVRLGIMGDRDYCTNCVSSKTSYILEGITIRCALFDDEQQCQRVLAKLSAEKEVFKNRLRYVDPLEHLRSGNLGGLHDLFEDLQLSFNSIIGCVDSSTESIVVFAKDKESAKILKDLVGSDIARLSDNGKAVCIKPSTKNDMERISQRFSANGNIIKALIPTNLFKGASSKVQ